jgi:hypothetical protein
MSIKPQRRSTICKIKCIFVLIARHEGNGWVTAVVIENLDEMINLKLPNDTTHWIHFDSDRTGPYLRVQSHTKNNVDFYKCQ